MASLEIGNDSDETVCSGTGGKGPENELTRDFLEWSKRPAGSDKKTPVSLVERYEMLEETILQKLETWLSYMDNFVAVQAVFPSLERRTRDSAVFRPLNFCLRQVAKIYIVMILIYLKRFLLRLQRINRLIGVVKTEAAIIRGNFLMKGSHVTEYHERCLRVLYTEKVKAVVEIVGYANDLVLNLSLVTKRFRLGRALRKLVGFVSWMVNVYRLCRDETQDAKNDAAMAEIEARVAV